MNPLFSHRDVQRHWGNTTAEVAIRRQEFGHSCFSDRESENSIEIFNAPKELFPDLLSFWVAAIKQSFLGDAEDGERWASEYLAGGGVGSLTTDEFVEWLSRFTDILLTEPELELPQPSDQFVRVWINFLDDALVGVVPSGYWAIRWYSTA